MSRSLSITVNYHTQIANYPIRSRVNCLDILIYQVTDLICLRCIAHLAEFGSYGVAMGILDGISLIKIGTMARTHSPGMLLAWVSEVAKPLKGL